VIEAVRTIDRQMALDDGVEQLDDGLEVAAIGEKALTGEPFADSCFGDGFGAGREDEWATAGA
jgi:hypothetical protein